MSSPINITWVILAGGRATRMGGRDKGLVELNQLPLIEYVHSRLKQQGASIAINANRNQDIYQTYGKVFSDQFTDFPGPLGGIHAAMLHLSSDWLGFVPCDCPNLPPNLLEKMYAHIGENSEILVAHDGEAIQPVITLMHRCILPRLEAFLAAGDRKIVLLYERCHTQYVDFSEEHDAFVNLNTPDELEKYGALT